MTIDVQLFARAKDLAGADRISVDLPAGATVGDLRRHLAKLLPALAPLLDKSMLAVDHDSVADHHVLNEASDVALLPPVSGG
jgi:molybdopterin synthase sulfur carrier subunit